MVTPPASGEGRARRRFLVQGVVQGVGFRPFVYATASELGLTGSVTNSSAGVVVEVEGAAVRTSTRSSSGCARRRRRWPWSRASPPSTWPPVAAPVSRIGASTTGRRRSDAGLARRGHLRRLPARAGRPGRPAPPAPVHHLHQLRAALHDHRPSLPYDRAGHDDGAVPAVRPLRPRVRRPGRPPLPRPADRLPRLRPHARAGRRRPAPDRAATRRSPAPAALLAAGGVVAVKGLGGYHLACDAARRGRRRRRCARRKQRGDKPFAVMVGDVDDRPPARGAGPGRRARLLTGPAAPGRAAAPPRRRAASRRRVAPGQPRPRRAAGLHAAARAAARAARRPGRTRACW